MRSALAKFRSTDGLLFLLLLSLLLALRIFVLVDFAFEYTDSDQVIMWQGVKDFSNGEFHEPRFYGQAYNSMLESFLAVPLHKMGIPPYRSLPIITSILAIFPFILISFFVFLKKSPKLSLLILSIPLVLPVEYALITSLPRGFITGIFVSSFACIGIFYPKSNRAFFLSFLLAVIGFSLNANAVLLIIPCLAFLFAENIKNKRFYLYASLGMVVGFIIHFAANHFYVTHPFNDTHSFELTFLFSDMFAAFAELDLYFDDVTPIFRKAGIVSFLMFLLLAFLFLRKKEYFKMLIVALLPIIILLTLGINKVHDGTNSVYFSYSRMYLAIPVMLAFILSGLPGITDSRYVYIYLLVPFVFFGCQLSSLDKKISIATDPLIYKKITAAPTEKILANCNSLKAVCDTHKVELVVVIYHDLYNFYNYGLSAVTDDRPKTLAPARERRTWRFFEDEKKVYNTILLIDAEKNYPGIATCLPADSSFFLIENNPKYTLDLLRSLGVWVRDYKPPTP